VRFLLYPEKISRGRNWRSLEVFGMHRTGSFKRMKGAVDGLTEKLFFHHGRLGA
jgi:hypothetical protein